MREKAERVFESFIPEYPSPTVAAIERALQDATSEHEIEWQKKLTALSARNLELFHMVQEATKENLRLVDELSEERKKNAKLEAKAPTPWAYEQACKALADWKLKYQAAKLTARKYFRCHQHEYGRIAGDAALSKEIEKRLAELKKEQANG